MKRFLRAIEIVATTAFFLDIAFIWLAMFGDYHRVTYDVPGSVALPICLIVSGLARSARLGPGWWLT